MPQLRETEWLELKKQLIKDVMQRIDRFFDLIRGLYESVKTGHQQSFNGIY